MSDFTDVESLQQWLWPQYCLTAKEKVFIHTAKLNYYQGIFFNLSLAINMLLLTAYVIVTNNLANKVYI